MIWRKLKRVETIFEEDNKKAKYLNRGTSNTVLEMIEAFGRKDPVLLFQMKRRTEKH
jgi:hypothetical protein